MPTSAVKRERKRAEALGITIEQYEEKSRDVREKRKWMMMFQSLLESWCSEGGCTT